VNLDAAHAPELLLELLEDIDESEADEELAVMLDDDDPAPLPPPPLPLLNHQLVLMANIPEVGLFWSFPFPPPDEFIFLQLG